MSVKPRTIGIIDKRRHIYAEPISTAAKLLYLYLAARANAESVCWPGRDTISKDLSASVSTVGRALAELVKVKLIVVESNASKAGTNLYHVYSPDRRADEVGHTDLSTQDRDAMKGHTDRGERSHRPFIVGHTDPQRTTPVEVTTPEKKNSLSHFEEFWTAYPKKKSKGAAEKAWRKESPPLAEVLAAIVRLEQSRDWQKDGGQFIPYPATWIRDHGWLDEVPGTSAPMGDVNVGPSTPVGMYAAPGSVPWEHYGIKQ